MIFGALYCGSTTAIVPVPKDNVPTHNSVAIDNIIIAMTTPSTWTWSTRGSRCVVFLVRTHRFDSGIPGGSHEERCRTSVHNKSLGGPGETKRGRERRRQGFANRPGELFSGRSACRAAPHDSNPPSSTVRNATGDFSNTWSRRRCQAGPIASKAIASRQRCSAGTSVSILSLIPWSAWKPDDCGGRWSASI